MRVENLQTINDTLFIDETYNLLRSGTDLQNETPLLTKDQYLFLDNPAFQVYNTPFVQFERSFVFDETSFFLFESIEEAGVIFTQDIFTSTNRGETAELTYTTGGLAGVTSNRVTDIWQLQPGAFLLREEGFSNMFGFDVRYYRSTDNGMTWNFTNNIGDNETVIGEKLDYLWSVEGLFLYARKIPQLYVQFAVPIIPTPNTNQFFLEDGFFYDGKIILLYLDFAEQQAKILRSDNNGINWSSFDLDLAFLNGADFELHVLNDRYFISSSDPFSNEYKLYRTDNFVPQNFIEVNLSGLTFPSQINSINELGDGELLLGLENGQSLTSGDNGASWEQESIGLGYYYNVSSVNGRGLLRNGRGFYFESDVEEWTLFNPQAVPGFRPAEASEVVFDGNQYYFAEGNSVYFTSDIGSNNWMVSIQGFPGSDYRVSAQEEQVIAYNLFNAFRSIDGGNSWQAIDLSALSAIQGGGTVISVQALQNNALIVNVLDPQGNTFAYQSNNGGASWSFLNTAGLDLKGAAVYFEANNQKHYATVINPNGFNNWQITLYESLDNGQNWNTFTNNFPISAPLAQFPIIYHNGALFTVSRDENIFYYSEDKGLTWQIVDIPFDYLYDVHINSEGRIWASTQGKGVWTTTLDELEISGDRPDLEVSISADDIYLQLFQNRIFEITVKNTGTLDATNVILNVPIPLNLAYVEHEATKGILLPFVGDWEIGTLAPGDSAVLTYTLFMLTEVDQVDFFVEISVMDGQDFDSTPGNGTCCSPQEDDEAIFSLQVPPLGLGQIDLELHVTADNETLVLFEFRELSFSVVNNGLESAEDIVVNVPTPEGLAFVSFESTDGDFDAFAEEWTIDRLDPGQEAVLDYQVYITNDALPIAVFTEVIAASGAPELDSSPDNGVCCVPLEDDEAVVLLGGDFNNNPGVDLELEIEADTVEFGAFENRVITLTLNNRGAENAFQVSTNFPLPEGDLAYVDHFLTQGELDLFNKIWGVGNIPAGGYATLVYRVFTLTEGEIIPVFAEVETASPEDLDSSPGNGVCCIPVEDDEDVVNLGDPDEGIGDIDLELEMTVDNAELEVFQERIFMAKVTNNGPETAFGIEVDFPLPANMAYVSHEVSKGVFDNFSGIWQIGNIPPNATVNLTYKLYMLSEDENINVFAQVSKAFPADVDSAPNNASCCTVNEDDEFLIVMNTPMVKSDGTIRSEQKEKAIIKEATLFPNPASKEVSILINDSFINTLYVLNNQGVIMKSLDVLANDNSSIFTIDVHLWPSGVYFVKTNTGQVMRFVKIQ